MVTSIEKMVLLLNVLMGIKNGGSMTNFTEKAVLLLKMLMVIKHGG
jgi:hypothetical protein